MEKQKYKFKANWKEIAFIMVPGQGLTGFVKEFKLSFGYDFFLSILALSLTAIGSLYIYMKVEDKSNLVKWFAFLGLIVFFWTLGFGLTYLKRHI